LRHFMRTVLPATFSSAIWYLALQLSQRNFKGYPLTPQTNPHARALLGRFHAPEVLDDLRLVFRPDVLGGLAVRAPLPLDRPSLAPSRLKGASAGAP
jgi:hypothetical protein